MGQHTLWPLETELMENGHLEHLRDQSTWSLMNMPAPKVLSYKSNRCQSRQGGSNKVSKSSKLELLPYKSLSWPTTTNFWVFLINKLTLVSFCRSLIKTNAHNVKLHPPLLEDCDQVLFSVGHVQGQTDISSKVGQVSQRFICDSTIVQSLQCLQNRQSSVSFLYLDGKFSAESLVLPQLLRISRFIYHPDQKYGENLRQDTHCNSLIPTATQDANQVHP